MDNGKLVIKGKWVNTRENRCDTRIHGCLDMYLYGRITRIDTPSPKDTGGVTGVTIK